MLSPMMLSLSFSGKISHKNAAESSLGTAGFSKQHFQSIKEFRKLCQSRSLV